MSDLGQIRSDFNVQVGQDQQAFLCFQAEGTGATALIPCLWNKSSCPLSLPWKKFMTSDPALEKISCPLAMPWNKIPCPLNLPWKKIHALWPCPGKKVSCPSGPTLPYNIIDIISSFLTIIIPLKAGCRGLPESLNWRFWPPCCLKMRERQNWHLLCSACPILLLEPYF